MGVSSAISGHEPLVGQDDGGLTELRAETLKTLIFMIGALGYLVVIVSLETVPSTAPPPPWYPLPLLAGLTLTAGATYLALRRGLGVSTAVMTLGLTATLAALILLHSGGTLADYFFLIVLATAGAAEWRAGLTAAVFVTAVIVGLQLREPGLIPGEIFDQSLILVWLALALSWLQSRPLRMTVEWSWRSYSLAREKVVEARLRQAELAQVSKSLAEACARLECLNHELHEAKEAAEVARRMKAEFAATVGHELRTPVNLIIGFSDMMASQPHSTYYHEPLPESYRRDLQTIHHNARHISSLVDDILDLSQIDAHRMALHKEPTHLAQVARDAADNVAPLYAEAGLYLSVDVPKDLPLVPADPVRVRQILINLLYNAVRFTHEGGVVVTAYLTNADCVVSVHDTGVGIPPDGLGRMFEEFRQVHVPERGHVGSGLGLAVCKRFVELHGGNIWAESEPDIGTTISFSLPLHDNVATTPFSRLPAPVEPPDSTRRGIAVLDHTGDTVRVFQRYLDGYDVYGVTHPNQANELVASGELRALIVTSSDMDRAWRDYQVESPELRSVPTVFCPLRTPATIAEGLGVTAYLTKPVGRDQLARVLQTLPQGVQRILIIEDDAEMRILLTRILQSLKPEAEIQEAGNGESGLQLIQAHPPDLVLLDLLMPSALDGYDVIRTIQGDEALGRIPVVVISAKGPDEEVTIETIAVSRYNGLTVGEAMLHLAANLDASLRQPRAAGEVTRPGMRNPARPAGSPA